MTEKSKSRDDENVGNHGGEAGGRAENERGSGSRSERSSRAKRASAETSKAPSRSTRGSRETSAQKERARKGPSKRGFAAMDERKQREIASAGGRAAHEKGVAHEFTPEEAREAGRKGGQASHGRSRERASHG
jgi:general stress protein YciG